MMAYFNRTTDIASLTFFRFWAGLFLAYELLFALSLGDFQEYAHQGFHFNYLLFSWVKPLSEQAMSVLFAGTIIAGVLVAFGLFYRIASVILFSGYMALFLMEASQYVNHLYLYCLVSFWLMLMPLHRNASLDAWRNPQIRSEEIPVWMLHLFRLQLALVYFFAGIAKLHPDWASARLPEIFLTTRGVNIEGFPQVMAVGGLLFDLFIALFLVIRKTRKIAFIAAVLFHLSNVALFGLGSFPWFALMMTTLFFDPSWPRRISEKLFFTGKSRFNTSKLMAGFVCIYAIAQVMVPLRHHLYPHEPAWSEEGHNFAWRMKARIKRGHVTYTVRDRSSELRWKIDPSKYLTETQAKDLSGNPEFILQFAHFLRDKYRAQGWDVSVYANASAGINLHRFQTLVDPERDLALEERKIGHYDWIMKRDASSEYNGAAGYRVSRSANKESRHSARSGDAPEAQAQHH